MSDQEENAGNEWPEYNEEVLSDISDEAAHAELYFGSEHESEDHDADYPSSPDMTLHLNGNSINRFQVRRERFLRMAYDVLHIKSMSEFLRSAKIDDEKELMRKYEDILVRMESASNDYARKKHEARLKKKEQHKKFFEGMQSVHYDSDVSTPSLSEEEPILLSENEIANLSPISRIRYFQSIQMTYHAYLSE